MDTDRRKRNAERKAANQSPHPSKTTAFASALETATNPATRGGSTILAMQNLRKELKGYCRQLARQIQATLSVTDQQRYDLGLTVPKQRSPIGPPIVAPKIDVLSIEGRTITVRLHDGTGSRRAKPDGVAGLSVFSHVGDQPPASIGDWKFEGSTTRTVVSVAFSPSLEPGTTVFLTAFWRNPRDMSGPAAEPVSCTFGGAGVVTQGQTMKIAA